jgi:hypothetical protein
MFVIVLKHDLFSWERKSILRWRLLIVSGLYITVTASLECLCGIYCRMKISLHVSHRLMLLDSTPTCFKWSKVVLHVLLTVLCLILKTESWKWGADFFRDLYLLNYIIATYIKPQVSCIPSH